ncbi:MAG: transporter substrate-binding domain-containing protein [Bermanella sp.]
MKWICFCILLFTQFASGQELLVVRGNGNYSPYEMEQDGTLTGFHIELLKVVAKQLDINLTFQSLPWKRALAMVENGTADAISYAGESAQRKEYIIFTKGNELSWVIMDLVILNKRRNEIVAGDKGLSSLEKYQFGQMIGYSYGEEYDNANLKKKIFNKTEQLVGMLRNERIDIAIVNRYEFKDKGFNKNSESEKLVLLGKVIEIAAFIGFSKKRDHYELSKKFAKALDNYKQSKAFNALQKKFDARYK